MEAYQSIQIGNNIIIYSDSKKPSATTIEFARENEERMCNGTIRFETTMKTRKYEQNVSEVVKIMNAKR